MIILRQRKSFLLLLILAIILSVANVYLLIYKIKIQQDISYRFKPASYKDLYYQVEGLRIEGFEKLSNRQLLVKIPSKTDSWKITTEGQNEYEVSGKYPVIKMLNGLHIYKITSQKEGLSITLKIDFVASEVYKSAGNTTPDNYHIVHSSIPISNDSQYSISDFIFSYDKKEIEQAQSIVKAKTNILDSDDTLRKLEKLSVFLLNDLHDKGGVPSDVMEHSPPLLQYKYAIEKKYSIWCSNIAQIYTFFANSIGIPTRLVAAEGTIDGIKLTGHVFAESYIKEKDQWAFVDLTSKKIFVKDKNNNLLNTVDLFHIRLNKTYGGLTANIYQDSKSVLVPYSQVSNNEEYYFNQDMTFSFKTRKYSSSTPSNLKKMLKIITNPELSYSLQSSYNYYLLLAVFFGELLIIAVLLLFFRKDLKILIKDIINCFIFFIPKKKNSI